MTRAPERFRRLVRDRAEGRCEYCLIHEDDVNGRIEPQMASGRATEHLLQFNTEANIADRVRFIAAGRYPKYGMSNSDYYQAKKPRAMCRIHANWRAASPCGWCQVLLPASDRRGPSPRRF